MREGAILSTAVHNAADARAWVTGVLDECAESLIATAVLLTSELVTNAMVHGSPPVELAVSTEPEVIKVAVTDGAVSRPIMLNAGPSDIHGRGIAIVAALADAWGVAERHGGKTVWFAIRFRDDRND